MTPWLDDGDVRLFLGDALEVLAGLPDESVDCVVTSPPYWGLRDYGTGEWDGGDPDCDHRVRQDARVESSTLGGGKATTGHQREGFKESCPRCGARRVDQQLGLEPTPDLFVAGMVEVFREVRRVLAPHGTCWVNLGDSYATGTSTPSKPSGDVDVGYWENADKLGRSRIDGREAGLKPKDLLGIPWMVARALQAPYYTGDIRSERDRVWLAATIDAEGTICGFRHERKDDGRVRTGVHIHITNTSRRMLDEAQRIWPTSREDHNPHGEGHFGSLPIWRWIAHGAEKKAQLLRELYPHLLVKRTQALLAYNLLLFQMDGKRLGRSAHGDEVRAKRELLTRLLVDANAQRDVDVPSWCREPETLFEPGWYLRSDVIWGKPNPMPESVTDRPTKSHEYVFLLTRQPRYWFDAEAVREPAGHPPFNGFRGGGAYIEQGRGASNGDKSGASSSVRPVTAPPQDETLGDLPGEAPRGPDGRRATRVEARDGSIQHRDGERWPNPAGRNIRSVWQIATQPYPEAHFATFPEELARRCILAGCPERVCRVCGKPSERIVETAYVPHGESAKSGGDYAGGERTSGDLTHAKFRPQEMPHGRATRVDTTVGWSDCGHNALWRPGRVLDPFVGSGTVAKVARDHQRHAIGIDLNETYLELAARRLQQLSLLNEAQA